MKATANNSLRVIAEFFAPSGETNRMQDIDRFKFLLAPTKPRSSSTATPCGANGEAK
jgi:hypothetical protein